MAVTKRIGLGILLDVDILGGTNFTNLAAIVDAPDNSGAKADVADTTLLADTFKTKAKAQIDPGEVTFTIAYDPSDGTTSQKLATVLADVINTANWRITFPAYAGAAQKIETFLAQLTGMGRTLKKDKLNIAPITLTISGNPGFATS
jgi:hypothetical protein